MKKIFYTALLFSVGLVNAQNPLLNSDFWKNTPDLKSVKAEIAKGHSPSEANRGNHDVVSFAINNNAPMETILFLIEQDGNSIDKITHDGRLYIHWAANRGNAELVKYLIGADSDIHRTDDKGATPLSFAAGFGQTNTDIYELFFKAGVDPKKKYQNGATLLLMAVGNDKDLKLTDYLTTKGLSLNDTDDFGNTAFNYACRAGNMEILKQLLDRKVKYDGRALIFASQGTRFATNTLDTYKFLVEELKISSKSTGDNGENVLHNLVRRPKQEEIITYFMEKGVDINQVTKDGTTVLMNAVNADGELLKTIISETKNINAKDKDGLSALTLAVNYGKPESVELLLNSGADFKTTDNKGDNLAYYLVQSYRPVGQGQKDNFSEKLTMLEKAGVDFKSPQKDGNTLCHLAVAKNDLNLIKAIEKFGADINAKNEEGLTALHRACLVAKDDTVIKYLVSKGAKKDILTEFDETAYDLASENEFLINNKVSIDFLK